jgi:hypothetical protein
MTWAPWSGERPPARDLALVGVAAERPVVGALERAELELVLVHGLGVLGGLAHEGVPAQRGMTDGGIRGPRPKGGARGRLLGRRRRHGRPVGAGL